MSSFNSIPSFTFFSFVRDLLHATLVSRFHVSSPRILASSGIPCLPHRRFRSRGPLPGPSRSLCSKQHRVSRAQGQYEFNIHFDTRVDPLCFRRERKSSMRKQRLVYRLHEVNRKHDSSPPKKLCVSCMRCDNFV